MLRIFVANSYRCSGSSIFSHLTSTKVYSFRTFAYSLPCTSKELSKHVKKDASHSFGQKAKEATKLTYYGAIVVAGLGTFGLMMYAIFGELFASFSPQSVYSCAVDKVTAHPKVIDLLGDSIKSHGELSRRGRRQHVSNFPYEVDGVKGMRIQFYLKGQRRSGSVHLDARVTSSGWEFRYLFFQLDSYPHEVIIVEDNRTSFIESEPVSIKSETQNAPVNSTLLPSPIFGDIHEA